MRALLHKLGRFVQRRGVQRRNAVSCLGGLAGCHKRACPAAYYWYA
jgi:hypothetical protein